MTFNEKHVLCCVPLLPTLFHPRHGDGAIGVHPHLAPSEGLHSPLGWLKRKKHSLWLSSLTAWRKAPALVWIQNCGLKLIRKAQWPHTQSQPLHQILLIPGKHNLGMSQIQMERTSLCQRASSTKPGRAAPVGVVIQGSVPHSRGKKISFVKVQRVPNLGVRWSSGLYWNYSTLLWCESCHRHYINE